MYLFAVTQQCMSHFSFTTLYCLLHAGRTMLIRVLGVCPLVLHVDGVCVSELRQDITPYILLHPRLATKAIVVKDTESCSSIFLGGVCKGF